MYFMTITTDDTVIRSAAPIEDEGYDFLKDALNDGTLSAINFNIEDLGIQGSMYLDDNGKLDGLEPNFFATEIYIATYGLGHDFIVGPVVLTGPVDDDGYDTGLTFEQTESISIWLGEFIDQEASA